MRVLSHPRHPRGRDRGRSHLLLGGLVLALVVVLAGPALDPGPASAVNATTDRGVAASSAGVATSASAGVATSSSGGVVPEPILPTSDASADPDLAAVFAAGSGSDGLIDVTGWFVPGTSGATYVPVEPVRLLDTRVANGLSGMFAASLPRTVQITGRGGVPADALAVTLNLTVTAQTAAGFVTVGPTPEASPATSSINFPRGDNRANGLTVPLAPDGSLSAVYKASGGARTHLVIDVTGWFVPGTSGATYVPVEPVRLLDTRVANGLAGMFAASLPRTVQITGRGGVPADALAVTLNLTVTAQTAAGFVTVGPTPEASPATSSINFPRGDNRANGLTVPLAPDGSLSAVYKASGGARTHLVIDVTGWFVPGTSGATYVPVEPVRLLDTRVANGLAGMFAASLPRTVQITGRGGVPADALAVTLNLTVTAQTAAGFVTVGPTPEASPATSSINFPRGDNRANGLTVPLAPDGSLSAVYKGPKTRDFPSSHAGYHSEWEMITTIRAAEIAHPDIVDVFTIGQSHEGRSIWAAKISDNVATDEDEPEVLFDGGTHADEHMGVEMALRILGWLVDGYGSDSRVTNIVDTREVWIVFMVNPDGAVFDIGGGRFHFWRKNRQPTPGSRYVGTDLNRNFGYRWGSGGNTSTNPQAITYRGPSAFSAPETRAMRSFMASRVVDGRQQIRASITFHEYGRLVMWPYGYTYVDVPGDMTVQDRSALVAIGKEMAASNGYRPQQASDLYLTSGTTRDYAYGAYRIFSYTFELSVKDYPDDSLIASETGRNREAMLKLMERAWCPLAILGSAVQRARCGAFDDDLEVERGWTVDPDGTDTAPAAARFSRTNPSPTTSNGPKQLGTTPSGSVAFVTGGPSGTSPGAADLDGRSTIRSARIVLPSGSGQDLTFAFVFAHDAGASSADTLKAIVERADGSRVVVWTMAGTAADRDGAWTTATVSLDAFAGTAIHLRFEATDGGSDNLVEVEIDDVRVTRPT